MKTLPLIGLLAACCVISTAWAAEPAPAKPAAAPAATPAKPAAAESATPKSDEDPQAKDGPKAADEGGATQAAGQTKPSAADKAGDKSSPQRFTPSEQVRADFDVSFPIDI
jgi:hypothetical protein